MSPRDAVSLGIIMVAAVAAAIFFRVSTEARRIEPASAHRGYEAARQRLPILRSVRVRSADPHAAHRLRQAKGRHFEQVLDPKRVEAVFRYGRLLYAKPEFVKALERALRKRPAEGELLDWVARLPDTPDVGTYFRDRRGRYDCDVLLKDEGDARADQALETIRATLPDADVAGETLERIRERRTRPAVARALLLALAVALLASWRSRTVPIERRAAVVTAALACVGVQGAGVDPWTVAAVVAVASGHAVAAVALLPALAWGWAAETPALVRIGIVGVAACATLALLEVLRPRTRLAGPHLDTGTGATASPPAGGGRRGAGRAECALLVLVLAGFAAVWPARAPEQRVRLPKSVRDDPAVALGTPDALRALARDLEREGRGPTVGDAILLPPDPDRATALRIRRIYHKASRWGRAMEAGPEQEAFHTIA
ncbi:MAG: hypothetical protein OER88_02845, partial [Planctomycetota bacterium]|nr:hypothetical protein [Planctomycetota bacterium]